MELALGVELNPEFRQLLHVCNGVTVEDDFIVPLWPIEEIVAETLSRRNDPELREYHMPMTHLVFIGSEGNGDLYALGVSATGVMGQNVFLWDHETDGRRWVAGSLEAYFKLITEQLCGQKAG
jgi:hypothetical protein